jgi:hypothetical protein
MAAMLDSLLDRERRMRCRANDAAMAAGAPIVGGAPSQRLLNTYSPLRFTTSPARILLLRSAESARRKPT